MRMPSRVGHIVAAALLGLAAAPPVVLAAAAGPGASKHRLPSAQTRHAAATARRSRGHRHRGGSAARSHTLVVKDSAQLHLVKGNGNTLIERGRASGTLPGTVSVRLTLRAHTATSTFAIHTRDGTISGSGSGRLKLGKHGWDSFGGRLTVRHGTGRFRGAHGTGGLYGSVYRVTDRMSAQVYGTLRY